MNFFDGEVIDVVLERLQTNNDGSWVWTGYVFGDPERSSATIAGSGDTTLVGNVRSSEGYFQIRATPDGVPMVVEVDETRFPSCANSDADTIFSPPIPATRSSSTRDTGDVIDVLVAYTPAARQVVGGTSVINSMINLAETETNTIYSNSLINSQIRVVHKVEVDYEEEFSGVDLARLRASTDGYMDEIHDLRDAVGADMVSLIFNDDTYCGQAYLMSTESPSFEGNAFSVVDYSCAVGYYSFAHELGHNQGSQHAVGDSGLSQGAGVFNYSHGWRWLGSDSKEYRSVMAYEPGTRVNHFSNPNVTHMGGVTGQPLGQSDEAYNALSIGETADTVANFRQTPTALVVTPLHPFESLLNSDELPSTISKTYTLHNLGDSPLDWTASANQSWISLSDTGGTLAADNALQIVASFNATADALPPGYHSGLLTFSDTTNAIAHDRTVDLQILSLPRFVVTLDTDPGWHTTGSWQHGVPQGLESLGVRDPTSGFTGPNVYGYNLFGAYGSSMIDVRTLTSTAFDLSDLTGTEVSFYRWLGVEHPSFDQATFQISTNDITWTDLWQNSGNVFDDEWHFVTYDIASIADGQPTVYFRWTMGPTDSSNEYPGWNIDDIAVHGDLASSSLAEVWVDFGQIAAGFGTFSSPFNLVEEAADKVTGNGIIRIKGDSSVTETDETLMISKPLTLYSNNGDVVIGRSESP